MTDCIIEKCVRKSENDFCTKHDQAKKNIEKTFPYWEKAYNEEITWGKYLKKLIEDADIGVGIWVSEVAIYLLSEER